MPVKFAMAAMGLLEETYRLPMVPPRQASRNDRALLDALGCGGIGDDGVSDEPMTTPTLRASWFEPRCRRGRRAGQAPCGVRRAAAALSDGSVRAAEPDAASPSGWRVNAWVKQGILLGFRFGEVVDMSADHGAGRSSTRTRCRSRGSDAASGVRIVPGGSTVRDGAYLGQRRDLHAADVHQHRRLRR